MSNVSLVISSGEPLWVRSFHVREALSTPFDILVIAAAPRPDIDIGAAVGRPFVLEIAGGSGGSRRWTGVCAQMELLRGLPEGQGESTYRLRLVPGLWLLSHRRAHRIFQHMSAPEIAAAILGEWAIEPASWLAVSAHPKLEYRVQHGESDLAFVSRILEEAGITYFFEDGEVESRMVLADAPEGAEARPPIWYEDDPTRAVAREVVTEGQLSMEVRPGAHVLRDFDFRRPGYPLFAEAPRAPAPEGAYEQYHYMPGAFLVEGAAPGDTPVADDRGAARHDIAAGAALAARRSQAERGPGRRVSFRTNVVGLHPGVVFSIENHPSDQIDARRLLLAELSIEGAPDEEWTIRGVARFADMPYRPPLVTPKPRVFGVQSAVVVGPADQEIHTDELGRVRVQFHWDREGARDDRSSCWMRVSQGWAGPGYGMIALPRVGHEVIVGFLDGDPDQPLVVGRLFNQTAPVPYGLPENKTISTWKSDSSPGSGGFNELKFEDRKGRELVYVQAERDLDKLVKHDETERTGNDRKITVERDVTIDVLRDRTKHVFRDETEITDANRSITVHKNLTKHVVEDETEVTDANRSITVHRNLTKHVVEDEAETTDQNRTITVKRDLNKSVKGSETEKTSKNRSIKVKKNLKKMVYLAENETTGISRTIQVGGVRSATIGISDSTFVGMKYSVTISSLASLLGGGGGGEASSGGGEGGGEDDGGGESTSLTMEDKKIMLTTGKASITLEGGKITIEAEDDVVVKGKIIHLNPAS